MAGKQGAMLLAIVMVAAISGSCSAVTHIVGGTTGWTVPRTSSFYSTWASGQTFATGDVLVFNFATGTHTAAQVSRANHDSCNVQANTIGPVMTTAPANVTLTTAGTHYFICTIPTHCTGGQRLAVTVTGPSAGSPASSPAPAGGAATPAGSPTAPADSPAGGATSPSGTIPTASSPTAEGPGGASPPGNFAASTGVSLLSLVSAAVAALMI